MTATRRRHRVLHLMLVVALVFAGLGWGASRLVQSPQDAVANASAPPPSLVTATIESRVVSQDVVTRGTVVANQTVEAIPAGTPAGTNRAVISGRLPRPGTQIDAGDVIVEVSGRPVIALTGSVPAYRDLRTGSRGGDVIQLQETLRDIGYSIGDDNGVYGPDTDRAVQKLYADAGYPVPAGGGLPSAEVLFVTSLPASVVAVKGTLGGGTQEASIQVASGALQVRAEVPEAQASLVSDGIPVVLSAELLGESVNGVVEGKPGKTDAGTQPFLVRPDKPLSGAWAGQDVRVRVVAAETGKPVLAVPVTAIFTDGSGQTQVILVDPSADTISTASARRVAVTTGVVGGGYVEITPTGSAQELSEGGTVQLTDTPAVG